MLNYFIDAIIPCFILLVLVIAIREKKDVFRLFIDGVMEGLKIVYTIFPYILAITIAIGLLRSTGAINVILLPIRQLLNKFNIPSEILPLCLLRPLSGGASMSVAMDIFKTCGPDSIAGKMASIIMSANETTLYTVTVFLGAVKIKKVRGILIAGLIADFVATVTAIILVNIGMI